MILTATQVTVYAPKISASAATITASGLILIVQERICLLCNNYFLIEDMKVQGTATFNATARSIILATGVYWADHGFQTNDDMFIYNSYRNDSVVTIESLSNETVILTSVCSIVDEAFNNNAGKNIFFSAVKWPVSVQQAAAQMIYYDYDLRNKVASNIKSRSLGPLSESYTTGEKDEVYGYPIKVINQLDSFKMGRVF
jgi:hypothetical protein